MKKRFINLDLVQSVELCTDKLEVSIKMNSGDIFTKICKDAEETEMFYNEIRRNIKLTIEYY